MAVLALQMFFSLPPLPIPAEYLNLLAEGIFSKSFQSFSKPGTSGVLNWILWDSMTEVFKPHKNGTVLGKLGSRIPNRNTCNKSS
jgi:hypothetical protein